MEGAAILDARSVFDFLNTDSGKLPTDRRLALDLRLVQHYVEASKWTLRWVSGPQQLSGVLTKENGDTRYLFWVLANSQFQLLRDTQLESKVKKELSEADRRLREQEAPEEKQRRRNRQKSANHRRRDVVVNKIVYGLGQPPKKWEAKLSQYVRRKTVEGHWLRDGITSSALLGIRALRHLTTLSEA